VMGFLDCFGKQNGFSGLDHYKVSLRRLNYY